MMADTVFDYAAPLYTTAEHLKEIRVFRVNWAGMAICGCGDVQLRLRLPIISMQQNSPNLSRKSAERLPSNCRHLDWCANGVEPYICKTASMLDQINNLITTGHA